ncbi:MAG: hypothetical protein ACI920_001732 [Saprospiraceae bacterium]|jgi:hypothetical protein
MKKFTFSLLLLCFNMSLFAQIDCPTPSAVHWKERNNIYAPIDNAGHPFSYTSNNDNAIFVNTVNNPTEAATIFVTGLWIGGIDPGGNLKETVVTYDEDTGFRAGPVQLLNDFPDSTVCNNWDKIWTVSREEIETHLADLADNGFIDAPIISIFSWPANGNTDFESIEGFPLPEGSFGLAPFFDKNGDGNYEPEEGDFPLPIGLSENALPQEVTYCLFNDARLPTASSSFDPLQFQIGQTTYVYDCEANNALNNTVFVTYQMTNMAAESIDSLHIGMFVDFDLGCYYDDYIGSDTIRNAFFAYNEDNIDGISMGVCDGTPTFGENPPVQAITFLNKPLSYFTYHSTSGQSMGSDPNSPIEYYRYLTGSWRDGSPLEFGGDGYQEGTTPTAHAFPDDPNNPDGWSMNTTNLNALDRRAVGSSKVGILQPGQSFSIDMAFTYVREQSASNLENVTAMYDHIDQVQAAYDNGFFGDCMPTATTNLAAVDYNFEIYPNPASDMLTIKFPNFTLKTIRLMDVTGQIILEKSGQFQYETSLDLSQFSKGVYFLQMENGTQQFYEKISVQ